MFPETVLLGSSAKGTALPSTYSLHPGISIPSSSSLNSVPEYSVALIVSAAYASVIVHISLHIQDVSPGSGCISMLRYLPPPASTFKNTPAGRKVTPRFSALEVVSTTIRPMTPLGALMPKYCNFKLSIGLNLECALPVPIVSSSQKLSRYPT